MSEIPGGHASVRGLLMSTLDELSNSERKVGRALLAQYPTAGLTTAVDLAQAAGVSPPTVVRFVTRLGFGGFSSFQRALVHELNSELGSPLRQYAEKGGSSETGVLTQTYHAFTDMLEATYRELPESEFTKLVHLLCDPTRDIRILGGRFSRMISDYLMLHLRLLRSTVYGVTFDEFDRRATVIDANSSTVFVVFDYRRYTELSLRLAESVAERGATVCLMTDNWLSPIAKVSRIVIPTRVESASPFDSLVAGMAITESLIAAVAVELGADGEARLRQMEESPGV